MAYKWDVAEDLEVNLC